jgi:protein-glutamine gamma-glutamyltransferase
MVKMECRTGRSDETRMKQEEVMFQAPPRLLMGVAFLFWGAMQQQAFAGLIAAILFEARHWTVLRWAFGEKGFARAWQLCILFLIVSAVGVFQMEDRDPTDFLVVLSWMPFILMPIGLAQQYASDFGVPMTTFSFIARRKLALDRQLGRPVQVRPFQLGYPFLTLVLICSGIAVDDLLSYSIGVVLLLGVALYKMSDKGRRPKAWAFAYFLAASLAVGMAYGVILAYDYVMRMTSSGRAAESPDLSIETRTKIGQVTNLQQSKSIRWRYYVKAGEKPERLRLAAYNWSLGNDWRAKLRSRDYIEQIAPEREAGGDLENLLPAGELSYVFDEADLDRRDFGTSGRLEGLLTSQTIIPMALGTRRIDDLDAGGVAANSMGTVQVNQPEYGAASIQLSAHLGLPAGDHAPSDRDMELPLHEEDGIDEFLGKIGWKGLALGEPWEEAPPVISEEEAKELEHRLRMEFATRFKYSTFSDFSRSEKPISDFLNLQSVGHCEYFASATTMLMRKVGIPARYCVGYVVRERGEGLDEWILRGSHAHAWCQIYVGGTWRKEESDRKLEKPGKRKLEEWRCRGGRWVEVDLTPSGWLDERPAGWMQGLSDWFQKFRTAVILWFAGPVVSSVMNWVIGIFGIGLLIYLILKLMMTGKRNGGLTGNSWDERVRAQNSLRSFERWLAKRVGPRPVAVPMSTWLRAHLPTEEKGLAEQYEAAVFSRGGNEQKLSALRDQLVRVRKRMGRYKKTPGR